MSIFNLNVISASLGKSMEALSAEVAAEIREGIKNTAHATHAAIISGMQELTTNPEKRSAYLSALQLRKIPNGYIILLDSGWATKLEDGIPSYDMREVLLNSRKIVDKGSRSGSPWVQVSKKGKKYAFVPFKKNPHSKDSGKQTGDLMADMKQLTATNSRGRRQKLMRLFTGVDGKPIHGKAAQVGRGDDVPDFLKGMVKYQRPGSGGKKTFSDYIVFRTISENGSGWQHPGAPGYGLFKQAESFVKEQLEQIVQTLA